MNQKIKSLKINAFFNSSRALMALLFPLISFPYSTRILGPEGIGKVNFSQSIVTYFAMISALGIGSYGIREAAKIREDKKLLSKFVKEILCINLISTIIAYILLGIGLFIIPKFSSYRNLIVISSCSILFTTLGIEWLYNALEEFSYIAIRSFVFQSISLCLLFLLVKTKSDIYQYAGIAVFGSVGANICNFIHTKKIINFKYNTKLELKKHLKPIFLLFSMSVAISIYTSLDVTMLGFLSGNEEVGFYTAATKINKMVLSVITSAVAVLLPRLSYYISKDDKESFSILISKAFNVTLMLALPCTIGLSFLAKSTILLFSGIEFAPAIIVMKIMDPIIIAIAFSNLIGVQLFMPLGKEKITLISVIIGAITNFTLNFILIPKYGALGASIATVTAESSVTIVQFIFAKKYFIWNHIIKNSIQCLLGSFIMSGILLLISKLNLTDLLNILISVICGIISYGGILLIFKNKFLIELIHKENAK